MEKNYKSMYIIISCCINILMMYLGSCIMQWQKNFIKGISDIVLATKHNIEGKDLSI